MKKPFVPNNMPTFTCVQCGAPAPPHVTLAANDAGEVHEVAVDTWGTYFWDTLSHRDEFCSATCVTHWLTNKSVPP